MAANVFARSMNLLRTEAHIAEIDMIKAGVLPEYILEDPAFTMIGLPEPCPKGHVVLPAGWAWEVSNGNAYLYDGIGANVYRRRLETAPLRF